jgi:hypothetical protein
MVFFGVIFDPLDFFSNLLVAVLTFESLLLTFL